MNKLLCLIFFHKLSVVRTSSSGVCQKLYCKRCKKFFGINHDVKVFIPWDSELEEMMNIIN